MNRLLFISHIFPDGNDSWSGLENVALLKSLADRWQIRAVILRHTAGCHPRAADVAFRPEFVTVPKPNFLGLAWHCRRVAAALRGTLNRIRRDWPVETVLTAPLLPASCAVARVAAEFQLRFVALSLQDEAAPHLGGKSLRKLVASSLSRASGVVSDSETLSVLLSQSGFRNERMILATPGPVAAEACHRLLLASRA